MKNKILMSTILFLLAILLITVTVNATEESETEYVTFPSDEIKAYFVDNYDTDSDGEMSADEMNAITDLTFSNMDSLENLDFLDVCENLNNITIENCNNLTQLSYVPTTTNYYIRVNISECPINQISDIVNSKANIRINNTENIDSFKIDSVEVSNVYVCISNQIDNVNISNSTIQGLGIGGENEKVKNINLLTITNSINIQLWISCIENLCFENADIGGIQIGYSTINSYDFLNGLNAESFERLYISNTTVPADEDIVEALSKFENLDSLTFFPSNVIEELNFENSNISELDFGRGDYGEIKVTLKNMPNLKELDLYRKNYLFRIRKFRVFRRTFYIIILY